jgi:hypothetical protein
MKHPSFSRCRTALAVAVLALSTLAPQQAAAADKLTLRVNDARGGPGDLISVVVRTYASRPIGQGQICIGARRSTRTRAASTVGVAVEPAAGGGPFASLEKVEVFSARQDATFQFSFDGEEAEVTFRSPTGSINAVDGPLAVFHFRLSNAVQAGEVYEINLDIADSTIVDGSGQRLAIESKPGRLEIREGDNGGGEEEDSIALGVTGGKVRRGKTARVTLATRDAVPLSSGRIALRYDPTIIAGKPWVRIDPRYGKATVLVTTDTPGLVIIDFQSPDKSFNRTPGDLFEVRMVISRQAPRGRTPVAVDPGLSFLHDASGDALDLEIQNGSLVIR